MDLQFTPHIVPFAGAAFVLALVLQVAWSNRRDPVARWFAATLVAMLIWGVGYCFEIMATTVAGKLLFANIQFLGVATVSLCWWETVRRYLDVRSPPRAVTILLWLIAAATILLAFFNPGEVFRGSPRIVTGEAPFPVLHADYGLWYSLALVPISCILNLSSITLLVRAIIRAPRFYRRQYEILLTSLIIPMAGMLYYVLDLPPWHDYNLTVALSGISGLLLGLGLFRWRLFSILPLAHDRVIENLADGVIVVDREERVIDLNRSAERITDLARNRVLGQPAADSFSHFPVLVDALDSARGAETDALRRDMVIRRNGISSYFSVNSSAVTNHRGEVLGSTLVMHDVTERVRLFKQARELANKDDLTGLPNRRRFFELATKEFGRARRYHKQVSLLLFDIDHFKDVNDVHGHRAGDRLLHRLAEACRAALRDSDIVGRMGGEEFAVLLPETGPDVAADVANRLREAVSTIPIESDRARSRAPRSVTISVGVTQLDTTKVGAAESFDSAYERADRALYQAKALGRNAVVVSEETAVLRAVV
jgi:diguanylate cyclase (GGDEF)-like protein/PAS domain S-box-containing protein